ncbi:hypothetical protein [Arthrobacter woluwensis]|uniref:hypothetical protein n=1 Tax=Arthrobacter woluwensis TaxID=156980 RepID=UPI0011B274DE|nr:hypothetical protein [Arthrobacter woluwensis]
MRPAYFTLAGHDVENSHHGAQPNSAAGPRTEALQLQQILQTFALELESSWEHALRGEEHGFISEQLKKSSPELGIGKMKILRRLAGSAAALALLSPVSAASAYAAVNSRANVGLPTNEIVTVCPGVSYNSHTDAEGARLSQQQLAGLVRHMKSICRRPAGWESSAHAHAVKAPQTSGSGVTPSPMSNPALGGDLSAFLYMSDDGLNMNYFTQFSSMPNGDKTLDCAIMWDGGPFEACGHSSSYYSYAQTKTNVVSCPAPGHRIQVDAEMTYNTRMYWDSAFLTT